MQAVTITQITPPELETLIENSLKKILDLSKPNDLSQSEQLLTIQQASEFLSLSVPTLYGLVSKCAIPVLKKGKRLYFLKQELTAWIKTGRKKTSDEILNEANNYSYKKRLNNGR